MYTEANFYIEAIQHIVERLPNSNWKIEQSCNPSAFILGVSISGKVAYTINGQNYIIQWWSDFPSTWHHTCCSQPGRGSLAYGIHWMPALLPG